MLEGIAIPHTLTSRDSTGVVEATPRGLVTRNCTTHEINMQALCTSLRHMSHSYFAYMQETIIDIWNYDSIFYIVICRHHLWPFCDSISLSSFVCICNKRSSNYKWHLYTLESAPHTDRASALQWPIACLCSLPVETTYTPTTCSRWYDHEWLKADYKPDSSIHPSSWNTDTAVHHSGTQQLPTITKRWLTYVALSTSCHV